MSNERLIELAGAFASGEISAAERSELLSALPTVREEVRHEIAKIVDAAGALSMLVPAATPSPSLKARIMAQTSRQAPPITEALSFIPKAAESNWIPMKVPGAYVKLLSMNQQRGYAVALGKLDPNTSYPAHTHQGPEEVLVLTGDLWIGETRLAAGDFHHADAGSKHDINHSETGCTILIVLTTEDLMSQMA